MSVKKIGIIGSACAGKTTLCYTLLAGLKQAGIHADGVTQQDCRLDFDRALLDTHPLAQWALITNQINIEASMALKAGIDVLICDRTPLDLYEYYAHTMLGSSALFKAVKEWCITTYDYIYLLRSVPYAPSDVRCSEEFRDTIAQRLFQRAENLSWSNIIIEPEHSGDIQRAWRAEIVDTILTICGK